MVPLGSVADVREINGPLVLTRYNMYPAASINGNAAPGRQLRARPSTSWSRLANERAAASR